MAHVNSEASEIAAKFVGNTTIEIENGSSNSVLCDMNSVLSPHESDLLPELDDTSNNDIPSSGAKVISHFVEEVSNHSFQSKFEGCCLEFSNGTESSQLLFKESHDKQVHKVPENEMCDENMSKKIPENEKCDPVVATYLPQHKINHSNILENVPENKMCDREAITNALQNQISDSVIIENAAETGKSDIKNEGFLCESKISDVMIPACINLNLKNVVDKINNTNHPVIEILKESEMEDKQIYDDALECHNIELKKMNAHLENEILELKTKLSSQEIIFKKAELQMREEFLGNIEKLSKDCNTLRKEKEAMVIRYANSEKEVIKEKKSQQDLEKKLKDICKDRENILSKIKNLNSENCRLSSSCESKLLEIAKLQKCVEKLNADFNSREVRIKWLQNKLKTEISTHQETQLKYEHTLHRLNEMKEEAEQVRKDCQEMIKCYQEAEEIKSVKLDGQLKQKLTELEVHKQEKSDQEQVYQLLRHELEAIKKKQRLTMEENNALTLKINNLEKDRLEYEQNLSKQKDSQNILKQEVADLAARLAEMETLRLQLEREKEKSAASLREVERLRSTNAELQADMNACHMKEGELLKFTEGVTDTNVKLQSAHSLLEVKAQALEDELTQTKGQLSDMQQKYLQMVVEIEKAQKEHEDEVQLLARKLAEKTKSVEKLNTKLDEAENENRVLKRRHIASIKELSRELYECKKRLDIYDSSNCVRADSASLGSRSSSTVSLDVLNSNDSRTHLSSPATTSVSYNGEKSSTSNPSAQNSSDYPEIDKEMLIERIIKLQKTLAQKNDKIDFLEDHIVQLVREMRKNSKCVDFKTV